MNLNLVKSMYGAFGEYFLGKFRQTSKIKKHKTRALFFAVIVSIPAIIFSVALVLALGDVDAVSMILTGIVSLSASVISLPFLRRGMYNPVVNLLLSIQLAVWLFFAYGGFISFPESCLIIHGLIIISFAGIFGSKKTVSLIFLILSVGNAVRCVVLRQIAAPPNAPDVVILGAALAAIYGLFILVQNIIEGAYTTADDDLEKNLQIMQSLEQTINKQTHMLLKEKNTLKELNREYETELLMACKIQKKLIPSESPADYIHIFYKPMKHVGGDFFDFLRFRNSNRIGIFVSDVAGHGIPAAFVTSMVKSFILQSGGTRENPADLLYYLNNLLYNQTADNFVTAFYGIYTPDTRRFVFASAGHNPPFLLYENKVEVLDGKFGIPLAVFDNNELNHLNIEIVNNEVTIPPDSTLLLYTDGLVEERDRNNVQFQYGPMTDALLESRKIGGSRFIPNLYRRIVEFSGSDSFYDDVCMIYLDI